MKKEYIPVNCHCTNCEYYNICPQIITECINVVGTKGCEVLFVGQGGGDHERIQKKPFVGPAGRRLREIIAHIWKTNVPFNIALSNTVRCQPPGNRAPNDKELIFCQQYLQRDIAKLKPKLVIPLGLAAYKAIIQWDQRTTMAVIHGNMTLNPHITENMFYMGTYHPSYLIRIHGQTFDSEDRMNKIVINDIINGLHLSSIL